MRARSSWALVGLAIVVVAATSSEVHAANARLARVVLLRSADRLSVALEMTAEPHKAALRVLSANVLEVEVGPVDRPIREAELTPERAPFIKQISIRRHTAPDNAVYARARVTLYAPAHANVRVNGHVVYVDVVGPKPPSALPTFQQISISSRKLSAQGLVPGTAADTASSQGDYDQTMKALLARLNEVRPFLHSAAAEPATDVLQAVGRLLMEVDERLRAMHVPRASRPMHDLLTSGVTVAGRAVAPNFRGDRVVEARQGLALIDAASNQLR